MSWLKCNSKKKHPSGLYFFFPVLIPVQGCCLFLLCIKPCLIGSEISLCSQGNQGEFNFTAAQTGVERRVPRAAKG